MTNWLDREIDLDLTIRMYHDEGWSRRAIACWLVSQHCFTWPVAWWIVDDVLG